MSGATTELNLATAVDSDDNADYLTLSLANSLRTVDGLFNSVTGHTHGGAHQGGPVAIPDGSIQAVDIANGAITNAKLASDTARASLLVNGGLEIWQRGPGPFAADASGSKYLADRWIAQVSGTNTMTATWDTTNGVQTGGSCAALAGTFGSGVSRIFQYLTDNLVQLRGPALTLSVAVKGAAAGLSVRAYWSDGITNQFGSNVLTTTGYTTVSATFTLAANATVLAVGLDFTSSGTYYIDNAMLVVGSVPADYAPLHPADDLARCLRYYEIVGETASEYQFGGYGAAASSIVQIPMTYKARKAVSPTVTITTPWGLGGTAATPTVSGAGVSALSIQTVTTGPGMAYLSNPARGVLLESNP